MSSSNLRLRTISLTLISATLLFAVALGADFLGRKDAAEREFVRSGQLRADTVAAMASVSGKAVAPLVSAVSAQADVLGVRLLDAGGKTIVEKIQPSQAPRRLFRAPVRFSSGAQGMVELYLETPGEAGRSSLIGPVAAIAAVFAAVLFLALSRLLIGPFERLLRRARELAEERDLHAPITLKVEGAAELRELTEILNTMSRREFDIKQQMEDKVDHANTALVSTVGQLQIRSAELKDRTHELEAALEEIKRIATSDSLTGLHNRRYFDERLGNALARAQRSKQPISMIMLDVDKFKQINDTLGHAAGDAVLEGLARLIKARTRASDVSARLGGDEFAFIMENTNLPEARKLGTDLLASVVSHRFTYNANAIPVTLSIGIAHFAETSRDAEIMYKAADDALYDAKRNGRNQVAAYSFDGDGNRLT